MVVGVCGISDDRTFLASDGSTGWIILFKTEIKTTFDSLLFELHFGLWWGAFLKLKSLVRATFLAKMTVKQLRVPFSFLNKFTFFNFH